MKMLLPVCAALTIVVVGCQSNSEAPTTATTPATGSAAIGSNFAAVQTTFASKCAGCHGATNPKDGVSMVSYESIQKGGSHGPILVAGNPEGSVLVDVLRARNGKKQMPPAGPLPEAEIAAIEAWIKDGAKN
jgi:mono/diheme cytochrome c family protein